MNKINRLKREITEALEQTNQKMMGEEKNSREHYFFKGYNLALCEILDTLVKK